MREFKKNTEKRSYDSEIRKKNIFKKYVGNVLPSSFLFWHQPTFPTFEEGLRSISWSDMLLFEMNYCVLYWAPFDSSIKQSDQTTSLKLLNLYFDIYLKR